MDKNDLVFRSLSVKLNFKIYRKYMLLCTVMPFKFSHVLISLKDNKVILNLEVNVGEISER